MKKNPYIYLKEIELKFSPTDKNIRQSVRFESGSLPQNFSVEHGVWEPMEEGPNVEITNRGLTGFAIPAKIASPKVMTPKVVSKIKSNSVKKTEDDSELGNIV
ncbi:unnamed protein product [Arctia plantaginis]|uniref:Uncharacterized protein n=1 Tax=Arctia plantaginis TaxID=874455 RepID=A0A8S1AWJ7_ARCPL|nr:unnamed protein product [Arctia plantaginis]